MTVRRVLVYPDPILKRPAAPAAAVDDRVRALLADLGDTLDAHPGVGIAAPQLGEAVRAAVVDLGRAIRPPDGTNHGRLSMVNPRILAREGKRRGREGCLSLPDVVADVTRSRWIRVRFLDPGGEERTLECEGFEATAILHELDHLDGLLFVDRITSLTRGLLRRGRLPEKDAADPEAGTVTAVDGLVAASLADGRELVLRAARLSARVHRGQTRDEGTPYLDHPVRVARTLLADLGVRAPEILAAALLHDALEDAGRNGVDLDAASLAAETSPAVAAIVAAVTRRPEDGDHEVRDRVYLARVRAAGRAAVLVKLADRLDNLRAVGASPDPAKRRRYARETFLEYLPLAREAGVLEGELGAALAALVAREGLPAADFPGLELAPEAAVR